MIKVIDQKLCFWLLRLITVCMLGFTALNSTANAAAVHDTVNKLFAQPLVHWYGIYILDRKIGYARLETGKRRNSKPPSFSNTTYFEFSYTNEGALVKNQITGRETFSADAPYQLLTQESQALETLDSKLTGEDSTISTLSDKGYRIRSVKNAVVDQFEIPSEALTIDKIYADLFHILGAKNADGIGHSLMLNDELAKVSRVDFRIKAYQEKLLEGVRTTLFKVTYQDEQGTFSDIIDQRGISWKFSFGDLELRKEPEQKAKRRDASFDLGAAFQTQTTLRRHHLGSQKSLTFLVVGDDLDRVLKQSPHQKVRASTREGEKIVIVSSDPVFVDAERRKGNHDKQAFDNYLQPSPHYPIQNPAFQRFVDLHLKNQPDDKFQLLQNLITFVRQFVRDTPMAGSYDLLQILNKREGDCSEHALLFVALARHFDIPARESNGLIFNNDDRDPAFTGHTWAEVYMDNQWLDVDPAWGEVRINPTHIKTTEMGAAVKIERIELID